MRYLISTESEIEKVESCLKPDMFFDAVIIWEYAINIEKIEQISSDDVVVLAIADESIKSYIIKILESRNIVHIVDFIRIFDLNIPFSRADRLMLNPYVEKYEGMILGISHAEVGILPEKLNPAAVNLAVSSQDLYYNLLMMRYVFEKYPDKVRDMKYLIVEMYKYNYFNFDLSRSKMLLGYLGAGGYDGDMHNFSMNSNYNVGYSALKEAVLFQLYKGLTPEMVENWNSMFVFRGEQVKPTAYNGYPGIEERVRIVTKEDIAEYDYSPSNVRKHFQDTIDENNEIFRRILREAVAFQPDVKIYVLQMPMYCEAWERMKVYYLPWKNEFEDKIKEASAEIPFDYWDMTEHPIAKEADYWYDAEHLNYFGAAKFTEILKEKMESR